MISYYKWVFGQTWTSYIDGTKCRELLIRSLRNHIGRTVMLASGRDCYIESLEDALPSRTNAFISAMASVDQLSYIYSLRYTLGMGVI
jgi:hypothetical protein